MAPTTSGASVARPRSALLRFALLLGVAFALVGAAGSIAVLGLLQSKLDSEIMRAITAETARLSRLRGLNDLRLELSAAMAAPERDGGFHYLLVDRDGGCPVAGANADLTCPVGNLHAWPSGMPDREGWLRFTANAPALGRVVPLAEGRRLLVARSLAERAGMRRAALTAMGLASLLMLAVGGAVGWVAARHVLRRVDQMNAFCRTVADGRLDRRLPVAARPDEFDTLGAAINGMLAAIERLMGVVEHVSEHAAHDLRTPLARIRLMLERALRQAEAPAQRTVLERAIDELDCALESFAALLEIARNEAGGQRGFVACDLAEAAREALPGHALLAEARAIRVETRLEAAPLQGVPGLLRALAANLLHNAVKFAPDGSVVRVATGHDAAGAWLMVADSGPGIPEADLARVFERFEVGQRGAVQSGSGLGLALVRAIAQRHRLSVRLSNAEPGLRVEVRGAGAAHTGNIPETTTTD
jgi:signal transduction histidine kinase